jgi:hypothetical protein
VPESGDASRTRPVPDWAQYFATRRVLAAWPLRAAAIARTGRPQPQLALCELTLRGVAPAMGGDGDAQQAIDAREIEWLLDARVGHLVEE